jgi:hypothetical protein
VDSADGDRTVLMKRSVRFLPSMTSVAGTITEMNAEIGAGAGSTREAGDESQAIMLIFLFVSCVVLFSTVGPAAERLSGF